MLGVSDSMVRVAGSTLGGKGEEEEEGEEEGEAVEEGEALKEAAKP